jgi:8-oxo-dGTP diphosphatase
MEASTVSEQPRLAGCVVLDDEGRLLLIHRNTPERVQWETPGGRVEPGELSDVAAIRETREELGVEVEVVRPLGHAVFSEEGLTADYEWFLARIKSGLPQPMEPHRHDSVGFFSWDYLRGGELGLSKNALNLVAAHLAGDLGI